MKIVLNVIVVLLITATVVSCQAWKWSECRAVGHSKVYCILYGK